MTRLPLLLLVTVLAAVALGVSAAPAAAKAQSACWARVIQDWYDNGRIDGEYSVACYQQALQHLPPDVREYADAQDVIGRALAAAIAAKGRSAQGNGTGTNKQQVPPIPGSDGGGGSGNGGGGTGGGGTGPTSENGTGGKSLISKAFDRLGPGNANSIPIPLIVLGSLALLLLAAGAAGMVARKLQERQPKPATVPQRTTPDGPAV